MYGEGCGQERCGELGRLLTQRVLGEKVTASALFPHGVDLFDRLVVPTMRVYGGAAIELQQLLKKRDLGARLALLLWGMTLPPGPEILDLPSATECRAILDLVAAFRAARGCCGHQCAALWVVPPTLLGRIARSTSCVLDPRVCITMVLSMAVTIPALLVEDIPAGFVTIQERHWSRPANTRWVTIGDCFSKGASEICCLSTSPGLVKLGVDDCQNAACACPLSMSTLRSALSVGTRSLLEGASRN